MRYMYWFNREVHETNEVPLYDPYVDTVHREPHDKYGYWIDGEYSEWIHVPLESFPKDFQMALILLGVT